MTDRRWMQIGGVTGILFVVLVVVSIMISGNSPDATASTATMVAYIVSNRGALLASGVLSIIAEVALIWWVGTLGHLFRAADERSPLGLILLTAGAVTVCFALMGDLPILALAFVANQQGGLDNSSTTRVLSEISNQLNPSPFPLAVVLVALGIGLVRRAFAAPWVGWLSFVLAVVSLVGGVLSMTSTSSVGSLFDLIGIGGFGIVVLVTSFYLLRYRPAVAA